MKKRVLNKQGNFGVKILWRYTDMAIFVLRCFILTHPVWDATQIRLDYSHINISHCKTKLMLGDSVRQDSVYMYTVSQKRDSILLSISSPIY